MIDKKPTTKKKVATWAVICATCVGGFEGLRTVAYMDPVGIPTYCFGETQRSDGSRVQIGDRATIDECKEMLVERVQEFGAGVDGCVIGPLMPDRKAAYTSLAYNIGIGAFCKSSIARKHNTGDLAGACDAFLLYNKAGGVVWPGLNKRREKEREICRAGS